MRLGNVILAWWCWWALAVGLLPAARGAEETTGERLTGQRVMHEFDFEEREIHYEDLPMHWTKCEGPPDAYPHYASGHLSRTRQRSGEYSFALAPYGRSVGYEYGRRLIGARPGSDFHISGYVHLEEAPRARARLSCVLTDRAGREIAGSYCESELLGPADHDEQGWARLEVYVPGNFPQARFITLAVWVLQESQWSLDGANGARIFQPDVKALAWFDDITVYQLPRVIFRTNQVGNVFDEDTPVVLEVEVEGVSRLNYEIKLSVADAAGVIIRNETWMLGGVQDGKQGRKIEFPGLEPGLYTACMDIESEGMTVATRTLTFAKVAGLSGDPTVSGSGFGVLLLDKSGGDWSTAITLARMANARLIKVPVWRARADEPGSIFSEEDFDQKLLKLSRLDLQVAATFSEVPDSLWLQINSRKRTVLDVLSQDSQLWVPQVAAVLSRYARQIPYWQIGADVASEDQNWEPRIRGVVDAMRTEFDSLVGHTILAVPLSSMFEVKQEQTGTPYVALAVSSAIQPQAVSGYVADCRRRGFEHIWATIEPLDGEQYLREEVLSDFAKRVAFAKKGGAEAVYINHPWVQGVDNGRESYSPSELLLVFRTLADHLGGMTYAGEFELAEGVSAMIFDFDGRGCLVAWSEKGHWQDGESKEVRMYLGQEPAMVDLLGNVTTLPTENGTSRLRVGRQPVILKGIDTHIARLRASMALEPASLDGSIARQPMKVSFVNPFGSPVTGRARFIVDGEVGNNWQIEPASFNFVLRPHEMLEREVTIRLARNEVGGRKHLQMALAIDADRSYRLRTAVPLEICMQGVDVSIFARRLSEEDLLVQLVVSNISDSELSLNAYVDLPDGDHFERTISRLPAGANASKNFAIRGAARWVGRFLRVGLSDPRGTKRINYHVEIN